MTLTFPAFVDDAGHLGLDDKDAFRAEIAKLKGHEVVVTVRKKPRRQGSQAMRYYRGPVIEDIAAAMGELDPAEFQQIHEGLAWKFLRLPDGPMGEPRRKSTAKDAMSAEEFSEYLSNVILWAESSIPGCRIRRPDEVDLDRAVERVEAD